MWGCCMVWSGMTLSSARVAQLPGLLREGVPWICWVYWVFWGFAAGIYSTHPAGRGLGGSCTLKGTDPSHYHRLSRRRAKLCLRLRQGPTRRPGLSCGRSGAH